MTARPFQRGLRAWAACFAVLLVALPVEGEETPSVFDQAVLHLVNDDYVTGRLGDSSQENTLAWRSDRFVNEFLFERSFVKSIQFSEVEAKVAPAGDYRFALAGGDLLFGAIIAFDDQGALVDVPEFGKLHIDSAALRRISRWRDPKSLVYSGPGPINEWQISSVAVANNPGLASPSGRTILKRDVGLLPQSRIEFVLSWNKWPDFSLALGVGPVEQAFRFEIWEGTLVVLRETPQQADAIVLKQVASRERGETHLNVFLDQTAGRIFVMTAGGEPLVDLKVVADQQAAYPGVQLLRLTGFVEFNLLQVGRWNGEAPTEIGPGQVRLLLADGSFVSGRPAGFDAARNEFFVESSSDRRRFVADNVQEIVFPRSPVPQTDLWVAEFNNGQRMSGQLQKLLPDKICLKHPGIREELEIDLCHVRSLMAPRRQAETSKPAWIPAAALAADILSMEGTVLHGRLVDTETIDSPSLSWKPAFSQNASPLRWDASARITRAMESQNSAPRNNRNADNRPAIKVEVGPTAADATKNRNGVRMHLVNGDVASCRQFLINERGIVFSSNGIDSAVMEHNQLKAVEFTRGTTPAPIDKSKFQRLLTVPREQRENPPTHVIQSRWGDYLRCRVISMNEETIQIETRLQESRLPRNRVARIIWLRPEEEEDAAAPPQQISHAGGMAVRAVTTNGSQLRLTADRVGGTYLSGQHDILGNCHVDLQQLQLLLIGDAGNTVKPKSIFAAWNSHNAVDPKAISEEHEQDETELIGKPAPEISLQGLDGENFRLSNFQGKVVVLDFWASWCQPCRQAMPQIDEAVRAVRQQGVELVTINLQETKTEIRSALNLWKISPFVVLDANGKAAAAYGVTDIPQTFVIDRTGKLRRHFTGQNKIGERVREALLEILAEQPPPKQ